MFPVMVTLSDTLLAGILAAQLVQVGFEAKLLTQVSSMKPKVEAMWESFKDGGDIGNDAD